MPPPNRPAGAGAQVRVGRVAGIVVAVILVLALLGWVRTQTDDLGVPAAQPSPSGGAQVQSTDPESGLRWVDLTDLPPQAAQTVRLIDADGPFPYAKDGAAFGNNEGLLPNQRRGYYREFTVPTPGESDRGARRIIAGTEGELYWTADHYASFGRIRR